MKHSLPILLIALCLIGCSMKDGPSIADPNDPAGKGAPRMIISGRVTDTANVALPGIYISVPGVREPNEREILSYNYAITDSAGQYTIIRYRGRELPVEVTVVATDSTGLYQEQQRFVPVTYDTIRTVAGYTRYNAYVKADFVLSQEKSQP